LTQPGKGRIVREAPFLCIEILSPEDRASRMQEKIDDYISFGVRYVWVIDPRNRTGWVYTNEGRLEKAGVLTTQNPDLHLSLEDLFSALSEEITEAE
jgi:Uma2 family endonuclease